MNLPDCILNLSPEWIRSVQRPVFGYSALCGIELSDSIEDKLLNKENFQYPASSKYLSLSTTLLSLNILIDLANFLRFSAKLDLEYLENSTSKTSQIEISFLLTQFIIILIFRWFAYFRVE